MDLCDSIKIIHPNNKIKFQCLSCNLILNTKEDAYDHSMKSHPTIENKLDFRIVDVSHISKHPHKIFQCGICYVLINKEADLIPHLIKKHPENVASNEDEANIVLQSKDNAINISSSSGQKLVLNQAKDSRLVLEKVSENTYHIVEEENKEPKHSNKENKNPAQIVVTRDKILIKNNLKNPRQFFELSKINSDQKIQKNLDSYLLINYKCFVCFRFYPTESLLYKHINEKHFRIKSPAIYECIYCCARHYTKIETIAHIKQTHRFRINEITIRPLFISKRLRCVVCKKNFKNFILYRGHVKKHRFLNLCLECGKPFINPFDMTLHLRKHLKTGKNLCEFCGFFYTNKGLKQHMTLHKKMCNSRQKSGNCKVCEKKYNMIKNYIKKVNGRGFYPCFKCGKLFFRRIMLQQHKIYHSIYRVHAGRNSNQIEFCLY